MSRFQSCPMSDRFQRFVENDQQERMPAELVEHLSGCQTCQVAMEQIAVGPSSWLTGALACGLSSADRPAELRRAIDEMKGITTLQGATSPASTALSLDFLSACDHEGAMGAIGPYPVLEVVGQGGMGIVLKAIDPPLQRIVAIKVLSPHFAANATARRRFLREAQAAAAVAHEHVVGIHAVAEVNGLPYLVMEYVPGLSLQQRIDRDGPLAPMETIRIALQIAEGLAAAHAQGLVHRDIKPANILLENGVGRVRITDFGLARAVDDAACTQHGTVAGTPEYMAPEQAAGQPLDHRADLFSLGCVIYACCTGHSPFRSSSSLGALHQVTNFEPRPMRSLNVDVPPELDTIAGRLLAKSPNARFTGAQEVADALRKLLVDLHDPSYRHPRSSTSTSIFASVLARSVLVISAVAIVALASWVVPSVTSGLFPKSQENDQQRDPHGEATDALVPSPFNAAPPPPHYFPDARPPLEVVSFDKHTRPVRGLVVDPNNEYAVSCTGWPASDGTIRVWSLATGEELHSISVIEPDHLTMDALALAAKSKLILVGVSDGSVRGFSLSNQQPVLNMQAHDKAVNSICVSPDETFFATGGDDGSVKIWRCENGEPVHQIQEAHDGACRAVAFSPNGTAVASGGLDGAIRLWNVRDGKRERELSVPHGARKVWALAFTDNGQTIVAGGDGATAYDLATGAFQWTLHGHTWGTTVSDVAISADHSKLATCSYDGSFCVWELKSRRALFRGSAGVGVVWKVAFTADNDHLLTAGGGVFEGAKCLPGDRFSIRMWSLKPPES